MEEVEAMPEVLIRHINQGTYHPISSIVDEWWGGRQMAAMLPKLFFVRFSSTSFTAVDDGQIVVFPSVSCRMPLPTRPISTSLGCFTHVVEKGWGSSFTNLSVPQSLRFAVALLVA